MTGLVAYAFPFNPQPWALGDINISRQNGKLRATPVPEKTLVAYQNALREGLRNAGAEMHEGPYSIRFTFSRDLEQFLTPTGRTSQRNPADATNMQKATEDALQKILIHNDVDVIHIESDRCAQGVNVDPFVVIELKYEVHEWHTRRFPDDLYPKAQEALNGMKTLAQKRAEMNTEVWRP
jgi:hypothetical protein